MAQRRGPTSRIYSYALGQLWGEEEGKKIKKDWQQMLAQMPIFKKRKHRKERIQEMKHPCICGR